MLSQFRDRRVGTVVAGPDPCSADVGDSPVMRACRRAVVITAALCAIASLPTAVSAQTGAAIEFQRSRCFRPDEIPAGHMPLMPPTELTECRISRFETKLGGNRRIGLLTNIFVTPSSGDGGDAPAPSQQQVAVVGLLSSSAELRPLEWFVVPDFPTEGVDSMVGGRAAGEDFIEIRFLAGDMHPARSRLWLLRDDRLVELEDRVGETLPCPIRAGLSLRTGFEYDLRHLRAGAPLFSATDRDCCPTDRLEVELRIQGDRLIARRCLAPKSRPKP